MISILLLLVCAAVVFFGSYVAIRIFLEQGPSTERKDSSSHAPHN